MAIIGNLLVDKRRKAKTHVKGKLIRRYKRRKPNRVGEYFSIRMRV